MLLDHSARTSAGGDRRASARTRSRSHAPRTPPGRGRTWPGDHIQAIKAGSLEIADILSSIRPPDRQRSTVRPADMLQLGHARRLATPIHQTVATDGTGVAALVDRIASHAHFSKLVAAGRRVEPTMRGARCGPVEDRVAERSGAPDRGANWTPASRPSRRANRTSIRCRGSLARGARWRVILTMAPRESTAQKSNPALAALRSAAGRRERRHRHHTPKATDRARASRGCCSTRTASSRRQVRHPSRD